MVVGCYTGISCRLGHFESRSAVTSSWILHGGLRPESFSLGDSSDNLVRPATSACEHQRHGGVTGEEKGHCCLREAARQYSMRRLTCLCCMSVVFAHGPGRESKTLISATLNRPGTGATVHLSSLPLLSVRNQTWLPRCHPHGASVGLIRRWRGSITTHQHNAVMQLRTLHRCQQFIRS